MNKLSRVALSALLAVSLIFGSAAAAYAAAPVTTAGDLASAITAAANGDTITVSADITLTNTLAITKNISIVGATRGSGASSYTLGLPAGYTGRHFSASGSVTFENLTFDGGATGGGIKNTSAASGITVRGCTFQRNASDLMGGAIEANGPVMIERSSFINNKTTKTFFGQGGAVSSSSDVTISDSLFDSNGILFADGSGGAVAAKSLIADNSVFLDNAAGHGGALWILNGPTTLTNCEFYRNTAKAHYDTGGAVHANNTSTKLTIDASIFEDNTAASNGGAVYSNGTTAVSNSAFSGNIAASNGGAVYSYNALTVANSSFARNQSTDSYGGGIYSYGGVTVTTSSFVGNKAASGAGATACTSDMSVTNSTFYKNVAALSGGAVTVISGGHTGTFTSSTFYGDTANGVPKTIATGASVTFAFRGSIMQTPLDDVRGTFEDSLVYTDQEHEIFDDPEKIATFETDIPIGARDNGVVPFANRKLALDYLPLKVEGLADGAIDSTAASWLPATDELGVARDAAHADTGAVEVVKKEEPDNGDGGDSGGEDTGGTIDEENDPGAITPSTETSPTPTPPAKEPKSPSRAKIAAQTSSSPAKSAKGSSSSAATGDTAGLAALGAASALALAATFVTGLRKKARRTAHKNVN